MLVAALLVIPVIAVEQSDAGEPWRFLAGVLNWLIWIAFAVELVVMPRSCVTAGRGCVRIRLRLPLSS